MYQINLLGHIIRLSDNATIPPDPDNRHYVEYLAWLASGGVPQQDSESEAATQSRLTAAVQHYMDAEALSRGYDSLLSLCSYATSTVPKFAAEGQAGVEWRDLCWSLGYTILVDVQQELRPIPTEAELIAELPQMMWPTS